MTARRQTLLLVALSVVCARGAGQSFSYVEPGNASCPPPPAPTATPKTVQRGATVAGSIRVLCGFAEGSYTLTLNSTDPSATFAPKSFIVNFGRITGNGAFTASFSTVGVHDISVAITSNMGSPPVRGRFETPIREFKVVAP